jgi:Zn-dependent protease
LDADNASRFAIGLMAYVMLLFSLSVHECAHGWTARLHGDDTAEREGRVSLNPTVHIDPLGTVLMPLLMWMINGIPLFGWARPTPVHTRNLHPLRSGVVRTWGAGPLSNLCLALVFTGALFALRQAGYAQSPRDFSLVLLVIGVQMNVMLALFNMVPIPPLDGSYVMSWGLPPELGARYDKMMEPIGGWILLILFIPISWVISPVSAAFSSFLFSLID